MELRTGQPTGRVEETRLPARAVVRGLLAVVAALNVANAACIVAGADTPGTRYWLLALERNPSTWFSAALLAACGIAAWAAGRGRADAATWNVVAAILGVMSLDEVATFHERLGAVPAIPGIGSRGWAGAGLLLAGVVGFRLRRWVLALDGALCVSFFAGGAVFLAGAVGFEVISGNHQATNGSDTTYWTLATIEENLELLGVLVVLRGLLDHLARRGTAVTLRVA